MTECLRYYKQSANLSNGQECLNVVTVNTHKLKQNFMDLILGNHEETHAKKWAELKTQILVGRVVIQ